MPKIFTIKGYIVYFWSNENDEPIHVHVAKGAPRPNATKIWLTKSGGCVLAKKQDDVSQFHQLRQHKKDGDFVQSCGSLFTVCVVTAITFLWSGFALVNIFWTRTTKIYTAILRI